MKLTVIGGGSTYTPELVDGFARLGFPVSELALVDPAAERLEVIGGFAQRILARRGHSARVMTYQDLDAGIDGATAVLLQLRVGGQAARHVDETLPLECGCVGQETTGAGGLAKALRTVPVVLDIASRVERLAPKAWIVDFTNPVGIVTRALLDAGHRAVGLCNVAIGLQRTFASWLDVAPERLELDHVGLNHLTWERAVRLDGADITERILTEHGQELADRAKIPVELIRRMGAVPSYYLRYFYAHDEVVAEQRVEASRAERVATIERELMAMYADPAVVDKPALLEERGGAYYSEAAVQLVASLVENKGDTQVVNLRNRGTLPFLPDHAVIEVPATIGALGPEPLPVSPVEPRYAGLIAHVSAYEELALEAALHGGITRVADALLAHPLIGQATVAHDLADRLVAANRRYLPWT
ncbi:6-phospho-beta-glucosidase [Nonomuraea sediminis]|uniref:6-phospho-beta-glucosidase n=1 Tax=Nonomuraea sediminis TaxID=2835864 RepID=UPI001BDDA252|nr:6-phospho-beta-glucosidase [Nonomuraea sediminis]